MKKILLFAVALGQVWAVTAQSNANATGTARADAARLLEKQPVSQDKAPKINTDYKTSKAASQVLGITSYDLQTNATVHDRIAMNSNGDISVVWTASEENSTSFSDRGTGYSHFDPNTNSWVQSPNYPRIESNRCGWPSILYDGNGGEIIVSHSTASENLKMNSRSAIGTGNWSEKNITTQQFTWNRAAMGGTDGNTLHIVASTDADDSSMYQDMTSALVYFRSQDGGQTFDKNAVLLPNMDSATFGSGISNDAYAIIAEGDHVAIGLFNSWNDVMLYESTDNGSTWTPTVVDGSFPYRGFNDFDKQVDTNFYTICDGSGAIMFDNNGVVHMTWGRQQASMGDTPNDGSYTYRYFTDSLKYYRNTTPSVLKTISHYVDPGNDGSLPGLYGYYGAKSVLSMPNMAVGTDGTLYVVYSGTNDTIRSATDDETNMRNLYLITSSDNGNNWTEPLNITHAPGSWSTTECVYPDIYNTVDDKLRIVYHRDNIPAGYVSTLNNTSGPGPSSTWQTSVSSNEVVYYELDKSLNVGIERVISGASDLGLYPNPSDGLVRLNVRVLNDVDVNLTVTNMNGQVVYTYRDQKLKVGMNNVELDLSGLGNGMYLINIQAGEGLLTEKVIIR